MTQSYRIKLKKAGVANAYAYALEVPSDQAIEIVQSGKLTTSLERTLEMINP
jgi:hypothetical protein